MRGNGNDDVEMGGIVNAENHSRTPLVCMQMALSGVGLELGKLCCGVLYVLSFRHPLVVYGRSLVTSKQPPCPRRWLPAVDRTSIVHRSDTSSTEG